MTDSTYMLALIRMRAKIQPEKEIIVEFIKNEDYKYVRALGALYIRLVGKAIDIYQCVLLPSSCVAVHYLH